MDFLLGNREYVLEADWYEYNPKRTIDDEDTWEHAVPFTYKDITRSRSTEQAIQGLKKGIHGIIIETRAKYAFKPKDLITLDRGEYKVTQVEHVYDDNFTAKQIFKGLEYTKAILVLE
jgi:hypothetical protein